MTKQELIDKIKSIAKSKYNKQIEFTSGGRTNVIAKYPSVNDVLVDLMTEQYEIFVTGVEWVAPKPTTFRVMLANGDYFFLTHTDRSWIAQIEGKNFYLLNLSERIDAMNAISRVLRYSNGKNETSETAGATEEIPAEATPEELPPA
jgi:hypothetical protein